MATIGFDDFEIDLDLFTLTHGGEPVEIGAKPLNALIYLIENRHRVVDREMLRAHVWQGAALSDSAIPTCIMSIRQALGDDSRNAKYLESVRSRGYRFVGELRGLRNLLPTASSPSSKRLPFVGRQSELEQLEGAARQVLTDRRGQIVLLTGDPGVGKTRLVEEFSRQCEGRFEVHATRGAPIEGAPPFWPWSALLRTASEIDSQSDAVPTHHPGIETDVAEDGSASSNSGRLASARAERFNRLHAWTRSVLALASDGPALISIDDLHRLDYDSLLLLYWIADEISRHPLMIVASSRPKQPSSEATALFSEIADMGEATRIDVPPLTHRDIALFIDPLTHNVDDAAAILMSRTGGNAFYVSHLIWTLASNPHLDISDAAIDGAPLQASEIVSRQFADLPDATRRLLTIGAVLGEQFPTMVAAEIADLRPDATLEVLQPAVELGIGNESLGTFTFTHAILRGALYATTGSTARKNAHSRYASHLLRTPFSHARDTLVAHHLTSALPVGSPQVALEFNLRAARQAESRYAHGESKRLFENALRIRRELPASEDDTPVHIIEAELARATLYSGDRAEARVLLQSAAGSARELGDYESLSACALALAPDFLTIEVGTTDPILVSLLREALSRIPSARVDLYAMLLARLSIATQWSESQPARDKLADEALSAARESRSDSALVAALAAKIESLNGPHNAAHRLKLARQLSGHAQAAGDCAEMLMAHTRLISALLENGKVVEVETENELHKRLSNTFSLRQFSWLGVATDCTLATLHGRLDDADALADEYLRVAEGIDDANVRLTYDGQVVARMMERDRLDEVVPLISQLVANNPSIRFWRAILCWGYQQIGDAEDSRRILETFNASEFDRMKSEPGGGLGLALLAEVVSRIGTTDEANQLERLLAPLENASASAGYAVFYAGSFVRYIALLRRSLGEPQTATDLLRQSVNTEISRNAPSWAMLALADLIETLELSGDSAKVEIETARSLLAQHEALPIHRARNRLRDICDRFA